MIKFLKNPNFYRNLLIFFLVAFAIFIYAQVYFFSYLSGGDFEGYGYWWIALLKKHLLSDFSFPYFTPARCGGFLLGADGQVYIFSLYTLMHFLVPNVIWSMKITNICLSIILALGVYRWLFYLDIKSKAARLFTGLIISISGYWVFHLTNDGTQLHVQSLAYLPWILYQMEKLFARPFAFDRTNVKSGLWLTICLLLMGNGGYFWFQYFPYIFLGRLIAELISPTDGRIQALKKIAFIMLCFSGAILLSWPHLGGFLEFQVSKFPRHGDGMVAHYGVTGNFKQLFQQIFDSFFNSSHLIKNQGNGQIGGIWEFTNFIGAVALIPILMGLFRFKTLLKSKILWTFVFASLIQLAFVRTTHAADLLRALVPFFNSLSHYWRGSATFVLFLSIWMALGYAMFFQSRHRALMFLGILVMIAHLAEIHYVYKHRLNFDVDLIYNPSVLQIAREYKPVPVIAEKQYADCELCHLFGYSYWKKRPPVLSFNHRQNVYNSGDEEYYNMHNIKELFSADVSRGYYMSHKWPLWPKSDQADFEKFINYKQVFPLPLKLKIMNKISLLCWFIYGGLWIWVLWRRKETGTH